VAVNDEMCTYKYMHPSPTLPRFPSSTPTDVFSHTHPLQLLPVRGQKGEKTRIAVRYLRFASCLLRHHGLVSKQLRDPQTQQGAGYPGASRREHQSLLQERPEC